MDLVSKLDKLLIAISHHVEPVSKDHWTPIIILVS